LKCFFQNVPSDASDILAAFGIRKSFSKEQRGGLNHFFINVNQYPSKDQKIHLSSDLHLSLKQVSMWFDNKRRKSINLKK